MMEAYFYATFAWNGCPSSGSEEEVECPTLKGSSLRSETMIFAFFSKAEKSLKKPLSLGFCRYRKTPREGMIDVGAE